MQVSTWRNKMIASYWVEKQVQPFKSLKTQTHDLIKRKLVLLKNKSWLYLKISLHNVYSKDNKSSSIYPKLEKKSKKDSQLPGEESVSLGCDNGYQSRGYIWEALGYKSMILKTFGRIWSKQTIIIDKLVLSSVQTPRP